jgi:hypothetical protein
MTAAVGEVRRPSLGGVRGRKHPKVGISHGMFRACWSLTD